VEEYNVGVVTDSHEPVTLARIIEQMIDDEEKRITWKKNLQIAADELCWENEKGKIIEIYMQAGLIL
jgi:hypothetical protein